MSGALIPMVQNKFPSFEKRQHTLSNMNDMLDRLNSITPWDEFRPILGQVHIKERKSNAGRKPFDVILMFKLLILQTLYNISDDELEYQANDRLSFMRFLGLGLEDKIPDAKTIWLFREQLTRKNLITELFEKFNTYLQANGYQSKGGQLVDATLIPVPKQRNTREENQKISNGERPSEWEEKPHRASQKDTDARWTKKNNQSYFGYKNHINIDREYGLIRKYEITDASVHDSQMLGGLIDPENEKMKLWADSAYRSKVIESVLSMLGIESQIHERGFRNHPLTEEQKANNKEKSKIRAVVEHVFGSWVMEIGGKAVRAIGKERVSGIIGLKNLVYNMKRYLFLEQQEATI